MDREIGEVRVAVVGAGIIGVSLALSLKLAGYDVLLLDGEAPGCGCSFGNAGVIATSFVLPLSSFSHVLAAPRMLLDKSSPLAIRAKDLPFVAPWLLRFMAQALPARQRRTIAALRSLNGHSLSAWRSLLGTIGRKDLLIERGMVEVVRDGRGVRALVARAERLRNAGIRVRQLGPEDIGSLEPALKGRVTGGLFHDGVAHVGDPLDLTESLLEQFRAAGGKVRRSEVRQIVPTSGGVRLDTGSGAIEAREVVVAAGFASASLLAPLGARVPIGVEHGYHLMLPEGKNVLTRPVAFHTESFLATPMIRGLRLAGTVELARPAASPNWTRSDNLGRQVRPYLPNVRLDGTTRWMGGRPSFPDSLPAIGRMRELPQIIYAFGHQHLGLTQAAITAEVVLALVAERAAPVPLLPFALDRFRDGVPVARAEAC